VKYTASQKVAHRMDWRGFQSFGSSLHWADNL